MDYAKPGPGQYNIKTTLGDGVAKYSLRSKHNNKVSEAMPGPGNYEINTTLNTKNANNSPLKSTSNVIIGLHSARFPKSI